MKNLVVYAMLLGLLSMIPLGSFSQDYKKITGEWKFSSPEAPYGYQSGTITFTEDESNLKGEVKFQDGYKVNLKNIVLKDNELSLGLYIDYDYIKVNMTLEKEKFSGFVDTPDGKLKITAER
ncbi:MAG: hypothetical protein IH594_04835 [Bacteroidales bacterium]|nr:hypothetical protein [Bacteroidales bacterium]